MVRPYLSLGSGAASKAAPLQGPRLALLVDRANGGGTFLLATMAIANLAGEKSGQFSPRVGAAIERRIRSSPNESYLSSKTNTDRCHRDMPMAGTLAR